MLKDGGKIGDIIENMVSDKVDTVLSGEWFEEMVNQRVQFILNTKRKEDGKYKYQVEE